MADITPVTREEFYLAKAGGQDVPVPSAVTREEYYLEKLSNDSVVVPSPVTRREKFLYFACGGDIELPSEDKMIRIEKFMAKAGGRDVTTPTAVTREEKFWDAIIAESGIKTLTGRLPLYFRTSENKLRDWVIYGNNEPGKNIFEIIPRDQIIKETGTLTFATNAESGSITANGTCGSSESSIKQTFIVTSELAGDYYFSGSFNLTGSLSTFDAYLYDLTAHTFIKKWDGTTKSPTITGTESQEVKLIEGHNVELTIRVFINTTVDNVVFKPMLRKAGTSEAFEPYQIGVGEKTENGYVLNIDVGFAPISPFDPAVTLYTKKTIYIGESPLIEGQTLSMSDFGNIGTVQDSNLYIAAFKGFRYDDQLSSNQPRMKIKYKEYKE